jgi:hypothetical protein
MKKMCSILFSPICGASHLMAQPITSSKINSLAASMQKAFNMSGIAITKGGKLIHLKGYSVQPLVTDKKVWQHRFI